MACVAEVQAGLQGAVVVGQQVELNQAHMVKPKMVGETIAEETMEAELARAAVAGWVELKVVVVPSVG